ncbi:condensation domain-containing protein [Rhizohabitans arisaemae]|uniref:condensation domain-containing protein n=1 Tax=Rhizohabitans arisaemae TaxID=2720610 RepID=UPI0024B10448|nr:condensation domain-containing protein [Rhizohabitans arisaemae]
MDVVQRIPVTFADAGSRSGPLTFAQRNVLRSMRHQATDGHNFTLWQIVDVPAGGDLDAVAGAVHDLIVACESLRTRFEADEDPVQHVVGEGTIPLEVYEAGDAADEWAAELAVRWSRDRFDPAEARPLRVGVITQDGSPVKTVFVFAHLVVDAASVWALRHRFERQLSQGVRAVPPARQPIDKAVEERSEAGMRRAEAALKFWRERLRRGPQSMFAVPLHEPGRSVYRSARLRSRSVAANAARIAARTHTSPSAVVLATVAALIGLRVDRRTCLITSVASNRSAAGLADYVGPLAQDALLLFELEVPSFDALVRKTWSTAISAYRNSQFDAIRLWQTVEDVDQVRGTRYARDCVFNDRSDYLAGRRPLGPAQDSPPSRAAEPGGTEIAWIPAAFLPARLVFYVNRLDDAVEFVLWADTRRLPGPDIEAFLRGVDRVLAEAADADFDLGRLSEIAGVVPVVRDDRWRLIDSCWVDLDEVRELLHEAVQPEAGEVFAEGERLVAYLVVKGDPPTLAAIHAACRAALEERESAMTPHHYVICAQAPTVPGDPAEWARAAVLAEGSGREA